MRSIRNILSVVFAALVLFSSTSFVIGVHRCGGSIQTVAILHKAAGCAMERRPPCHRHEPVRCCEDQAFHYESQDFNGHSGQVEPQLPVAYDVVMPHILLSEVIPAYDFTRSYYQDYDPPLPPVDRIVALQTFLI